MFGLSLDRFYWYCVDCSSDTGHNGLIPVSFRLPTCTLAHRTAADQLTPPPVTVVATGTPTSMAFNTGKGQVAVIPEMAIKQGRFDHKIVTVPDSSDQPSR